MVATLVSMISVCLGFFCTLSNKGILKYATGGCLLKTTRKRKNCRKLYLKGKWLGRMTLIIPG